jgi:2-polyprenyl-3-methyl-5-hydroxy-6-metoxy-1,4-benzoquinol methylase
MSKLRDILSHRYAEHYARVNPSTDPLDVPRGWRRDMDLTFGPLLADKKPNARILDLGCGTGFLLSWLVTKPITVVGVDSCSQQLAVAANSLPNVDLVCEDGLAYLNKHVGEFDGIFCMDVLEHIPGEDALLEWVQAIVAATVPGGFICCRTPNAANLTGVYGRYMDLTHVRAFTRTSLFQLLEAAGMTRLSLVPQRAGHIRGRVRLTIETLVHKAVFRLSGRPYENAFAANVCVVGYKSGPPRSATGGSLPSGT